MDHNILVVEDEKGIREAIQIYLKNQGYRVFLAENGQEGLNIIKRETIHLAVVDIMMPVMDGITMTMEVRKDYDFPIIFLSAKSEDIDKITGLNIGADDYITKPFGSMELLARVRSQLRRYEQILMLKEHAVSSVNREEEIYSIGALELNSTTKEVRVDNQIDHVRYIAIEQNLSEDMEKLQQQLIDELALIPVNLNNLSSISSEDKKASKDYLTIMYDNLKALESIAS